jgi:hypothetical protein
MLCAEVGGIISECLEQRNERHAVFFDSNQPERASNHGARYLTGNIGY